VININAERNGPVVASLPVHDDDEIMLTTRSGMMVRTKVVDVRSTGRAASGVRIIRLADSDRLTGVARCVREDDDDAGDAALEALPPTD
jgi:DNA gyrase subunit A